MEDVIIKKQHIETKSQLYFQKQWESSYSN